MILGKILNFIYRKIINLKIIKRLEFKNKDIFINILDNKLLNRFSKKEKILEYKNLEIEISNKFRYFNSSFYTAKDNSFIIHYREFIPKIIIDKIFFIHGFGACTSFYDKIIRKLVDDGYYCLSLDLPGWGLSSKSNSYTQDIRAKQVNELLNFINHKNRNFDKWIAIGHSMGAGCVLNMNKKLIKKKILFNPAIKSIINNFFKLSNKYIVFLLELFSNKRWFMDNVLAFVDKEEIEEDLYMDVLKQLPDSFTMVKTLIEGFDTSNLINKNKNIPIYIFVADNDTVVGNHEGILMELLELKNVILLKFKGSHIYVLNNTEDAYKYIINCLNG